MCSKSSFVWPFGLFILEFDVFQNAYIPIILPFVFLLFLGKDDDWSLLPNFHVNFFRPSARRSLFEYKPKTAHNVDDTLMGLWTHSWTHASSWSKIAMDPTRLADSTYQGLIHFVLVNAKARRQVVVFSLSALERLTEKTLCRVRSPLFHAKFRVCKRELQHFTL